MGNRRILTARGPHQGLQTSRMVVPRELRSGGQRLHYVEGGVGAPLILIHGLGASSRWWFSVLPELTAESFRVVVPDLPGFGRSPGPARSIAEAARAVIDLADRLGLGRFFLCGHSMGGAIALRIAADYGRRVRRMVLIASAGIPGVGPTRVLGRLVQPWSWCPPRFYGTLIGDIIRAGPRNLLNAMAELRVYDVRPSLKRVRAPTLVIWGEKDSLTPLAHGQRIVEGLPDARLEVLPRTRHLPMVREPDITAGLMVRFLKEDLVPRSQNASGR